MALAGCEQAPPPQFRLNMVQMANNELDETYQQEIANAMGGLFGDPDEPHAPPESGLDNNRLKLAAGPAWTDQEGVNRGLYRKHCVHCHGVSGDGKGPTGMFLNPYPRDYRTGVFKFKSTYASAKPTDDDLHRVLVNGIPGTSMPSFSLLAGAELESLVEYVKYLAIRGEVETKLAEYAALELGEAEVEDEQGNVRTERIPFDPANNAEQRQVMSELVQEVVAAWQEASDNVIVPEEGMIPADERSPEEVAESVEKGRALFYGTRANCIKCHGPTALGDGQRTDHDIWNKQALEFVQGTEQLAESVEKQRTAGDDDDAARQRLADDVERLAVRREVVETLYPPRNAIPRNLRQGVYRGGRRRIDVFWRIHAGIPGSPMPGVGAAAPGGEGTLSEAEMWNIVDYVLSLPYESFSQPQRRLPIAPEEIIN